MQAWLCTFIGAMFLGADDVHSFPNAEAGLMCVEVAVDGDRVIAVVDTGATYTFLDKVFLPKLGKAMSQVKVSTISSSQDLSVFKSPPIVLGRSTLPTERVITTDLERLRTVSGIGRVAGPR